MHNVTTKTWQPKLGMPNFGHIFLSTKNGKPSFGHILCLPFFENLVTKIWKTKFCPYSPKLAKPGFDHLFTKPWKAKLWAYSFFYQNLENTILDMFFISSKLVLVPNIDKAGSERDELCRIGWERDESSWQWKMKVWMLGFDPRYVTLQWLL